MKLDNYYKFTTSTFIIAYFIGLVISILFYITGNLPAATGNINYTNLFYMTGVVNFRNLFNSIIINTIQLIEIPFNYLITAINFGFSHANLLLSPFLGQTTLLVYLIPQLFYFINYIIFSTISLKLVIFIIIKITNKILLINKKDVIINIKTFNKNDLLISYFSILSIIIGNLIQVNLIKTFFIFFINFKYISYLFIISFYIIIIIVSFHMIYKTIKSMLKSLNYIKKIIITK